MHTRVVWTHLHCPCQQDPGRAAPSREQRHSGALQGTPRFGLCVFLSLLSKEPSIPMTTSKAVRKKLRKNHIFPHMLISGYFMTPCLYTYIFIPLQLYKRTITHTSNIHAQKGWISQSRLIYRNQTFQKQLWAVSISTLGDQLIYGQDRYARPGILRVYLHTSQQTLNTRQNKQSVWKLV